MSDFRSAQSPVRDQGNRPTCVPFAVSAAHEWLVTDDVTRSPEDALWAAHQFGGSHVDEATSVHFALSGLSVHQLAEEEAWPYGSPRWPAPRPSEAQKPVRRRAIPSWREIDAEWQEICDQIESGNAVVLTLRFVSTAWSGLGIVDAISTAKANTNHAVLAVGVGQQPQPGTLIIKNSWGVGWGQSGYGVVSRRYIESFVVRVHALELINVSN